MDERRTSHTPDASGFALMIVTLIMVVAAAVIGGSVTLGSNHLLVNGYHQRNDQLAAASTAGLEKARAQLNGNPSLFPDTGYVVLESNVRVSNGAGGYIPGVRRSMYAGPIGVTTGQHGGVLGAVVSVATDAGGAKVVRRVMLTEESFAKFAYFTDLEPSHHISFGGGDQIWGPAHTNDILEIDGSGATFHAEAHTAKTLVNPQYGVFKKGYQENVAPIPLPPAAELTKLARYARAGGTHFVGTSDGGDGQATTRIEFMAIDLNGDGDQNDENEGFIRVYQSNNFAWVSGDVADWRNSKQCGHYASGGIHGLTTTFRTNSAHPVPNSTDDWGDAMTSASRRCYLGGSDSISGAFLANDADGPGSWLPWGGAVSPLLGARADKSYLFPISRGLNPDFEGVIYVEGKVILSGRVRGRVTVVASDDIIIGDDLTYVTDPGQGTCVDMMGFFSGDDVLVADNAVNAPVQPLTGLGNHDWLSLDDTKDEFIHGVVLALNQFRVESHDAGSTNAEACEANAWGRGCLYLTGGIIQKQPGAVGTTTSHSPRRGTGYVKRYSYDPCAAKEPPPYFPTTGHFIRGQEYNMDPIGFDVATFFAQYARP